jgi:hypothetical protein
MIGKRRWQLILICALLVAVFITSFFAFRVSRRVLDFRRSNGVAPIGPWMNIPHVARIYHVPPEILYDALDLPHNETRPLSAIGREQGRDVADVMDDLNRVIEEFYQLRAPPPPDAPSPPSPAEGKS